MRSLGRRWSSTSTSRSPSQRATPLGLDFVPLSGEPFQVATTRAQSGGLTPLLDALAAPVMAERIVALGGYDLAGAGDVIDVA
jgi:hypothetical protein